MFSQMGIIGACLCVIFSSQVAGADDTEATLRQLEASLIYESACQLKDEEQYDKAIRRFDRIILEYAETEYARLAVDRKSEVQSLKSQPEPINWVNRAGLVVFGTLFGTWSGMGTAIILDFDSPEMYGCAGCVAGPVGGMQASLRLTRDTRLSDGQASLINFGGAWGIWQATGAAMVADAGEKGTIAASIGGGALGFALSTAIVRGRYITPGDATMINFGGLWGVWLALCGAMIADLEDEDDILVSSMIGGDVGLITMAVLSPRLNTSRARARLINISGIVGTLYGFGTSVLFEINEGSNIWSAMCIGSVLGLAAGTFFTRNYDSEKGYFFKRVYSVNDTHRRMERSALSNVYHSTDMAMRKMANAKICLPLIGSSF